MLTTLKNAFKIKEIRTKILFTLVMLVVIRLGSQLPVPGVDRTYFSTWFAQQTGDAFSFFDAITGGSFLNMSILALNISPYITSSIIMQLLTIAIPKLEEMQRDGEDGRKKIASITRYVTVVLAVVQASAMSIGFGRQGLLVTFNALNVITCIAALTAGSAFMMWAGRGSPRRGSAMVFPSCWSSISCPVSLRIWPICLTSLYLARRRLRQCWRHVSSY